MSVQYNFEWDPVKAMANIQKHGVSFERAAGIFLDPFAVSIFDAEHSSHEDRWITIGKDRNEVVLVVIHTFRELDADHCNIRLISARKATKTENKQYAG
jgi:hypothetical protein